jgi:peroxiredoxin
MTRPVAKFAAVLLLFALIPLTVLPIDEDKTAATVKEQIDWDAHNVTVLFFILHDCPICNRYVPAINRVARDYRNRGFRFIAVYSDIDFPAEEAQKHSREYQFDFPFVIDADHRLAARFGIKVVPQVAVLNRKRELLYQGRIDDLYADIDKKRPAAIHHDLQEALENIAAGIKPARSWAPAVGCPIGYDQPGS